jgi:hypothetical protein
MFKLPAEPSSLNHSISVRVRLHGPPWLLVSIPQPNTKFGLLQLVAFLRQNSHHQELRP